MAVGLFSAGWAKLWRDEINRSAEFRAAGAGWEGTLVLRMAADPGDGDRRPPSVLVDLAGGSCRAARTASGDDERAAGFVIVADAATWHDLFAGRADLIFSIIRGKFSLARGTLAELVPHVAAARALLAAAGRVATRFPA
ncbi:MAG TPA: hypothetical protein VLW17_06865 [Thermoanaerobaculaceae bacterium]|nr:hypothetical protein [Thermoanaerobaculaceae bacterium]